MNQIVSTDFKATYLKRLLADTGGIIYLKRIPYISNRKSAIIFTVLVNDMKLTSRLLVIAFMLQLNFNEFNTDILYEYIVPFISNMIFADVG